jgi:hypothetical protein
MSPRATTGAAAKGKGKAATSANGQAGCAATWSPAEAYQRMRDDDLGIYDAKSIPPEPVDSLWKDRTYVGKINMLAGEGGDGKSQIATHEAAVITNPALSFADGSRPHGAGRAIILSAEDGAEDTIVPRLMAARADLSRVTILTAKITYYDAQGRPLISFASFQDLDYWREIFRRLKDASLLVADPLPAYMGRGVNDHRNNDVRAVLEPFAGLLKERRVAMRAITHLGKSVDLRSPVHRILGSVAYSNIARSVHVTGVDPDNPERRLLCHPKNNLGPRQPTLAYRIEPTTVEDQDVIPTSRVVFEEGTVALSAADILCPGRGRGGKPGPKTGQADHQAEWLYDFLRGRGQPTPVAAIFDAAGELGMVGTKGDNGKWSGGSTLYRAKDLVPDLQAERAGYRIDDLDVPLRDGGRRIRHWQLVGKDAAF